MRNRDFVIVGIFVVTFLLTGWLAWTLISMYPNFIFGILGLSLLGLTVSNGYMWNKLDV